MRLRRGLMAGVIGLWLLQPALATPVNLITNGDFETVTNGTGEIVPGQTTGTYITSATGWYSTSTSANAGYPFLFISNYATVASPGFGDAWDNGLRAIWGPANGSNNGLADSPTSGNFLVADGDYHATAISQTLSGLTVGTVYQVSFDWAAAQWSRNTGNTTEQWQVSLGGKTLNTSVYSLPSKGFSGWMHQVFTFMYDGSSNVLSFLAVGTPAGAPPMLLLDGVSMYNIPEPSSLGLLGGGGGVLLLGGLIRRRRAGTRGGCAGRLKG